MNLSKMESILTNLFFWIRFAHYKLEVRIFNALGLPIKHSIERLLTSLRIVSYIINPDNSIDLTANANYISFSLEKFPIKIRKVDGNFIYNVDVTTLKGCPEIINGSFYCANSNLTSLDYGPKIVRDICCDNNNITSLKGFPSYLNGHVSFLGNPVQEIIDLCPSKDFVELLNEYDVIRGNSVVETRLRQALEDSRGNVPGEFKFKHYKLI